MSVRIAKHIAAPITGQLLHGRLQYLPVGMMAEIDDRLQMHDCRDDYPLSVRIRQKYPARIAEAEKRLHFHLCNLSSGG